MKMFIAGQWIDKTETITVHDPFDNSVIDTVPHGTTEDLEKAISSAVKGFEIGSGFSAVSMKGSQHNDLFVKEGDSLHTQTNNSGGIQGGISNGSDVYFNVGFKPIATIMKNQKSFDADGNEIVLEGKGRHDVTVVPRAVPIVEAMAAMVIADHYLRNKVSAMKGL